MANNSKGSTLCWDCAKSCRVGLCPWVDKGEPVEGWWANDSTVLYQNKYNSPTGSVYEYRREDKSYEVIACPGFVRNSYRGGLFEKKNQANRFDITVERNKDARALAAAILLRAVSDWKALDGLSCLYMPDGDQVKECELREFFYSGWFAELLRLVSNRSPAAVRKELGVRESI